MSPTECWYTVKIGNEQKLKYSTKMRNSIEIFSFFWKLFLTPFSSFCKTLSVRAHATIFNAVFIGFTWLQLEVVHEITYQIVSFV